MSSSGYAWTGGRQRLHTSKSGVVDDAVRRTGVANESKRSSVGAMSEGRTREAEASRTRANLNTRRRQSSCLSSRTWIWPPVRSQVQAPPANRGARGSDPAASRSRQVQRDAAPATPIRATRSSKCGSLRARPTCSWSSIYDLFRNLSRRSFAWAACADLMACASRLRMGSISLTHDIRFRAKRLGWHGGMKTES